jgi:hypothetical protein
MTAKEFALLLAAGVAAWTFLFFAALALLTS